MLFRLILRKESLHLLFLLVALPVFSQQKADTARISRADSILLAKKISNWNALAFEEAELDSLLESLQEYRKVYEDMHALHINNSQGFPFAFEPLAGENAITNVPGKTSWRIPSNINMPKDTAELAFYPVTKLASLIRNKKITSVALTRYFLNRLKKYNDTLHCVISFTEDLAMEQARQADEEISKGKYRGPLHGIPFGIKDLFAVKGTRTTWGSTPYKDQVIDEDAFVYNQLRKAGAVLCAKLSLGALAYADLWFGGRTRNPWDMSRGSSGSSAGSASATSAGLLPFAIGTETWGSIVSPSHTCAVTGLRPSFGSVSRSGGMVLSWSLDKIGPICRNAEDAAIVFSYIKGAYTKDPSSVKRSFSFPSKIAPTRLRVAYAGNYFERLKKDAPEWKVLQDLEKAGVHLVKVNFPDSGIYKADLMNIIISAESAAAFEELTLDNRDDLIERQDKNFWPNIFRSARYIPAVEYINANRHRYALSKQIHDFMKDFDIIITPSFSGNQLAITNLTGHPVICLPAGPNDKGIPHSITFIANLYDEETLLTFARYFQDITDYEEKHPPYFIK